MLYRAHLIPLIVYIFYMRRMAVLRAKKLKHEIQVFNYKIISKRFILQYIFKKTD